MRRLLVILDLNGTLLHRLTRSEEISAARQKGLVPMASVHQNPLYPRPGLRSFLRGLLGMPGVEVAVWTSAQLKNALPMTLHAFSGLLEREAIVGLNPEVKQIHGNHPDEWVYGPHRLLFLWSQSECQRGACLPGTHKPLFVKDLQRVFSLHPQYSARNTLILDDSPEKLGDWNENHLLLKSYNVLEANLDDDAELERIGKLVASLAEDCDRPDYDVRSLLLRQRPAQ